MAAIEVPAIGSEHGPCADCNHASCISHRMDAAARCRLCSHPIGYGVPFYGNRQRQTIAHRLCSDWNAEDPDGFASEGLAEAEERFGEDCPA